MFPVRFTWILQRVLQHPYTLTGKFKIEIEAKIWHFEKWLG